MSQDTDLIQDELATLKARADLMGVSYHPSIGVDKLREKVSAAMAGKQEATDEKPADPVGPAQTAIPAAVAETEGEYRMRMKRLATELVRIRITCMNPNKKDWPGEIITVGNNLIGSIKKYVPFNSEDGYHVPRIMYEMLKARQCQIFSNEKSKNGITVRRGRLIREFAIEELPPLSETELHDLAQRQALAGAID